MGGSAHPTGTSTGPTRPGWAWLGRFAGSVLLLAVGCEVVLQSSLWTPRHADWTPDRGFRVFPHARIVRSQEGYFRGRTDARGRNDAPLLPPRPRRVLVLGDSYAQALQLAPSQNFASVAEDLLPDTEFWNAGVAGGSPATALAELPDLLDWQPDVVVVQVSEPDAWEIFDPGRPHVERDPSGVWSLRPGQTPRRRPSRALRWLSARSSIVEVLVRRGTGLAREETARVRARFRVVSRERSWKENWNESESLSAMEYLLEAIEARVPRVVLLVVPDIQYRQPDLRVLRPEIRVFWEETARRTGIELLDPTERMQSEYRRSRTPSHGFQNTRPGGGHLNRLGHRIVAECLAGALASPR